MDPVVAIGLGVVLLGTAVLSIGLWHPAGRRLRAERKEEDEREEGWGAQAAFAELRQEGARGPEPGEELSRGEVAPASARPRTPSRGSP